MTKSEYYQQVKDLCSKEYFSSGSISWEETTYKAACLLNSASKENNNEEHWINNARFDLNDQIWWFFHYWNQMPPDRQEWLKKANEMIGYHSLDTMLEFCNKKTL